jgi:formylglycine-generating enzyme required for sulfatase activity
MMRSFLFLMILSQVNVAFVLAEEELDETKAIAKIELLGGKVERDETLPGHPVVGISFKNSKLFNEKHLHLLNGFKHLNELDLGDLTITENGAKSVSQPFVLTKLLMDANQEEFDAIFAILKDIGKAGVLMLNSELAQLPFGPEVPSSDPKREIRAKRHANAAVALLRMRQPSKVWPLLKHGPDPRVRSYLVHRFAPLSVDPNIIIHQLDQETDITIRRALVLSLGQYDEDSLTETVRDGLLPTLQEAYKSDPDPGLHSAVEWLLRKWNHEGWLKQVNDGWSKDEEWKQRLENVEQTLAEKRENTSPQWYVNSQRQTMVVIPGPVEFTMGSPETEVGRMGSERQHRRRIGRSFALASTAVTLQQYRHFEKNYGEGFVADWVRQGDLPAIQIDWYMGAKYCNWLSEHEQLQPCYQIKGDEISLRENYLRLSGYRLPTEAEMEYAIRAGAVTSRFFGETDELLPNFAWYEKNSQKWMQPVGNLKPNDFGLFDIQGNVWVWCQERYAQYPQGNDKIDDTEDTVSLINDEDSRVLRGGSFLDPPPFVLSSFRLIDVPTDRHAAIGFRLARTLGSVPDSNPR